MSSYKYKKTTGGDDGDPLTLNETGIEMNSFTTEEEVKPGNAEEGVVEEEVVQVPNQLPRPCRVKTFYMSWALVTTGLLFGLILTALFGHGSKRSIKWCCVSQQELTKCSEMTVYFELETLQPPLSCQKKDSISACVDAIDSDTVDVMSMSSQLLYQYRDKLKPIMAEQVYPAHHGSNSQAVYGEYFVRAKLRNRTFPVQCNESYCTDEDTYFRSSYIVDNALKHSLKQTGKCPNNISIQADLARSLHDCAAVFTSVTALQNLAGTGKINESDIEVICLNASLTTLSRYMECTRIFTPTNTLVVSNKLREGTDAEMPMLIVELFHVAYLYFGRDGEYFQMFNSSKYESRDLMFTDAALKLIPLLPKCTAEAYLGSTYMEFEAGSSVDVDNRTCFTKAFPRPIISEIN